jgi:hypothetical protein
MRGIINLLLNTGNIEVSRARMNNRIVLTSVVLIVVATAAGWHVFPGNQRVRWVEIRDEYGDRLILEPMNDAVWQALIALHQKGGSMWIGGDVEADGTVWGFQFKPGTIIVAEVTAERLQTTIRGLSENIDYWLELGQAFVFAEVTAYSSLTVTVQLNANTVASGDTLIISAMVRDSTGHGVVGGHVTATIGELEILYLLTDSGDGTYQVQIVVPTLGAGIYPVVVTAQIEGHGWNRASQLVTVQEG